MNLCNSSVLVNIERSKSKEMDRQTSILHHRSFPMYCRLEGAAQIHEEKLNASQPWADRAMQRTKERRLPHNLSKHMNLPYTVLSVTRVTEVSNVNLEIDS